jgi:hypothetical protein
MHAHFRFPIDQSVLKVISETNVKLASSKHTFQPLTPNHLISTSPPPISGMIHTLKTMRRAKTLPSPTAFGLVLVLVAVAALAAPRAAPACQICIPFPEESAADHLLKSSSVLLAREDPARPFHFTSVEVLKGEPPTLPIDLFLDSSTRRILNTFPDRSIILVAGNDQNWKRIGTADSLFSPVVRNILEAAPAWQENPSQRTAFFATFLDHDNPQLRSLAHLEVAKAPYNQIKALGDAVPRGNLRGFLNDIKYAEWHALYILLLAQSDDPRDQAYLEESYQSAQRFDLNRNLSAWATALIELQEEEAIDTIEHHFFQNPDRTREELREIHKALSVHGTNGHTHLRDRIIMAYDTLLTHYPRMAPAVVNDLTAWNRRDLETTISRIAAAKPPLLDFQATLKLRSYLKSAKSE